MSEPPDPPDSDSSNKPTESDGIEPAEVEPEAQRGWHHWWDGWRRSRSAKITGGTAAVLAIYGGPPAVYAALVARHVVDPAQWGEFFKTVATPYGTVSAGLAALGAAGVALHNGTKQRRAERETADEQLDIARSQLTAAWADADRDHDASVVRDLRDRFTSATTQLAHETSVTIQQSGAYALGSLTDDWLAIGNRQEAQVCVDILCTYLRTHHVVAALAEGRPVGDDYDYSIPPADQPVRDTILRIFTNHLHSDTDKPGPWSNLSFDLTGSHLHAWRAAAAHFTGPAGFNGVHFTGDTRFTEAHFTGTAVFDGAHFTGTTNFVGARFTGLTRFDGAHFTGQTQFAGAYFTVHTLFDGAHLTGTTDFVGARFTGHTWFDGAHFTGQTQFAGAYFTGQTQFAGAYFTAGLTQFDRPRAWVGVSVDWEASGDAPEYVSPRQWPPEVSTPLQYG